MDERMVSLLWTIDGTLTADKALYWTVPRGMTLHHVSAVGSNAHDGTISIGLAASAAAAVALTAMGDSGVPVEIWRSGMVDTVNGYHYEKGDVFMATVVYGDVLGDAIADLQVVITFLVG